MMKRFLVWVLACGVCGAVWAQEGQSLPPQEEPPFKIVIEEVPEEVPEQTPEAQVQPSEQEDPVVEEAEETPSEDPVLNCGHSLQPPKVYDTEVLMLQIFLDRNNFSCGVLDGVWGEGSRLAMRAWQKAQGLAQKQWIDVALYARLAEMDEPLMQYTVTAEDKALVTGPMPPTWAERAALKLMGYETLGACLAEKFHTSERTLRKLNPAIINWPDDLAVGTVLTVPNVRMAALERPASLVIALEECVLAGFDAEGKMCLRFPCSIARSRAHLPKTGDLKIINMAPAPNYTYDPRNYGQDPSVGKMVVPAGPRNPVGCRWIGLSLAGYGIHGTPRPNSVGRPESRGCFRLTNWNVTKLFELVSPGMTVAVVKKLSDFTPPKVAVATKREKPVSQPAPTKAPEAEAKPAPEPVKETPKAESAVAPSKEQA